MNLIVAVDENWGIGYKNKLLVKIPEDLSFFRRMTEGKIIVYGRKTLETFPNKAPLKKRINVVFSSDKSYAVENVSIVHSIDELLEFLKIYDTEDVFVIGGASIYSQLLPYCKTAYVTKIDRRYEADVYFPDLDKKPEWELVSCDNHFYDGIPFHFTKYEKK